MAEPLGSAELILTVNDQALRQGLAEARRLLGDLQNDVNRTTTRARRGQRTAGGGTGPTANNRRETKAERDLEILKEKRFRLARRIDALEERGVGTSRLRTQLGRLTTAYADREFATARNISRELARQVTLSEVKERSARRAAREAKAQADENVRSARGLGRVNLEGSRREIGSPIFSERGFSRGGARESINALTNAQRRRYSLDQQIRSLEAAGVRTEKLRAQLGEATTAQARRQFGSFNQIADSLEFTLRKERDRLKVSRDQSRELERQATEGRRIGRLNASPVRGGLAFPGSPGALAAVQAEGLRIGRFNSSPVRGGTAFPGSPAANEAIVSRNLKVRSSWTKALDFLDETASLIAFNAKASAQREGLRVGRLNASPLRGGTSFPGSPAFLDSIFPAFPKEFFAQQKREADKQAREAAARARRGRDAAGSAIIGGAFPLLFGQGIGASLGGGIGGGLGGAIGGQFGFGLSLVGTALGAQFDLAIQKSGDLAKALSDPIGQFGALQRNALLSSKGLEKQIEALIAMGREAEAAALIQEDLAKTFGDLAGAKDYLAATDNLNRAWTEASVTLTAFIAGPLAALLQSLSSPLKAFNAANRVTAATRQLNPQQRQQIEAFTRRRQQELGLPGIGSSDLDNLQLNLDILKEIERLRGKDSSALKAAAAAQRVLTGLTERQLQIAELIARAELGGNKSLASTLQLQNALIANGEKRLQLEQALRAGRIKTQEKVDQTQATYRDDQRLRQRFIDNSKESLDNSIRELQVTKQLSGLEGTRLEVAKRRIELSKLFGERAQRGQEFVAARNALDQNPNNLNLQVLAQGAANALGTAGVNFEIALRNASDYLKKAAKDAADSLTQAKLTLGGLETSPGGLNRFLTREELGRQQQQAITRLGPDLEAGIAKAAQLLNLSTAEASRRFQDLREIFFNAQRGIASESGFEAIQGFLNDVRARDQATTGLGDAQKTLADVTSLNATVQTELKGAIQANNLLLSNLIGKDWSVNVAVNGAQSAAYGDVLNRAAYLP